MASMQTFFEALETKIKSVRVTLKLHANSRMRAPHTLNTKTLLQVLFGELPVSKYHEHDFGAAQ